MEHHHSIKCSGNTTLQTFIASSLPLTCRFRRSTIAVCVGVLMGGHSPSPAYAASTDIANVPMAVTNMVNPNVLVVYDNSQSMDAYMNGTLVSGNDPMTRGNIGRQVLRNAIGTYRNAFNWGLMSYGMTGAPGLYNTYAYYLGSNAGMVFTDDCVGYVAGNPPTVGVSASNGGRNCIANPQPFAPGGGFVTYDRAGDDADILDVLYTSGVYAGMWGITAGAGTNYDIYLKHKVASGNSWVSGAFTGPQGTWGFTPTDAGFLSSNPPITRQVYVPRGWGYNGNITGFGFLDEVVAPDSVAHFASLTAKLANETNGATTELKNGAVFTPLRGTLQTAKSYFADTLAGKATPVQYSCQQNFVMLVTDGLPTGRTDGNLYSAADRATTCSWSTVTNSCTTGAFGTAAKDAINAVTALRTTSVPGHTSSNLDGSQTAPATPSGKYDIQTYVVALGDTVANANALSVMNSMAYNGGTLEAIPANNASSFANAIQKISDDITAKVGSAAAVAVANAHVSSSDNDSFASSYNSGTWTGDLDSNAINPATGIPSTVSSWTLGSASAQLDARSPASRYIATSTESPGACTPNCGVQFQPTSAATATKLSATQELLLNTPGYTDGAAVLAYLRGDRSGEPVIYRSRAHLLGDMVNGEPVVVAAPDKSYSDAGYSTFKTTHTGRTRVVFQGANDGMLHAFVASNGTESWAYVPNLVLSSLNNLSRKVGFTHRYYVDGTPEVADVDFGSGNWHTVLVGGLGKGGRGYYALDVTSPTAASEVDVKNKVLWEFPNSIVNAAVRVTAALNMGYSFGKPVLVKTTASGWVALVTSGYNNGTNAGDSGGDGVGHLYVINPQTGDLIKDIPTTGCHATPTTDPCGLAQISASITSAHTVDYVYGGDLKGNLWRFDFTGASVASWNVSKFTTLVDSGGVAQPISAAPALSIVSGKTMVQIGTGQYLGDSDITGTVGANFASSQTQTIYGLMDSLVALPLPLRSYLQQQTFTTSAGHRTMSNNAVDYSTKHGWYIDLSFGERINTQCGIALDNLVCTSNTPSPTKCQPGGDSWEYVLSSKTGSKANRDTNSWSGTFLGSVLASRPVIITNSTGQQFSLVRLSNATTHTTTLPPPPATAPAFRRTSWRQLFPR